MFDIGFSEMIILGVIALIAIGPKQLPEVARVIGRFINDVRRVTGEFTSTIVNARDSANQFLVDTQSQINKSIEKPQENPPEDPDAAQLKLTLEEKPQDTPPEQSPDKTVKRDPA